MTSLRSTGQPAWPWRAKLTKGDVDRLRRPAHLPYSSCSRTSSENCALVEEADGCPLA